MVGLMATKRHVGFVIAVGILLSMLPVGAASAHRPISRGRYKPCTYTKPQFGVCNGWRGNGGIKIIDGRHYSYKTGGEWRNGKYRHTDSARIRFRTGPLHRELSAEDWNCKHRTPLGYTSEGISCWSTHYTDVRREWAYSG